jgi:hypothetical protein
MAYTAEISRTNPSCFIFLIDQSGSMSDQFSSINKPKSEAVADAVNNLLQQLVIKCAKSEGVRDYYYVGVIGYGDRGASPAFSGSLGNKDLVPISEIANNPARIEERTKKVPDGAGGLVDMTIKFPIWFDPKASGGTPMKEAFKKAQSMLISWLEQHQSCFPPVVIHITDGESTDGDPSSEMESIKNMSSIDGNIILFNVHASAKSSNPVSFCGSSTPLPDQYAEMLFRGASVLPDFMKSIARREYSLNLPEDARAFVLNGDATIIITAIDIGTRPSNLLR